MTTPGAKDTAVTRTTTWQPVIREGMHEDVRVGVYVRRSTDDEHQPYSIEAQDARLASYIGSQPGWRQAARFADDASGATTHRPGLQRARAAARAEVIDVLPVYRVDRLTRSLRDLVTLLGDLDHAGVVFRSATEPFDTATAMGRMLVQMLRRLAARRDELASQLATAPMVPPPAALGQVADHIDQVIGSGTHTQRKALIEALAAQVKITGPGRIAPVFRIPQATGHVGRSEASGVSALTNFGGADVPLCEPRSCDRRSHPPGTSAQITRQEGRAIAVPADGTSR